MYTQDEKTRNRISGMIIDLEQTFRKSNHQLSIVTHSQEELELINTDFETHPFIAVKLEAGNPFEPQTTEKMYRELKGVNAYYSIQDREKALQHELYDFQAHIELLEGWSRQYTQYITDTRSGKTVDLTFILSNPESPLMAVFRDHKVMVYNFAC